RWRAFCGSGPWGTGVDSFSWREEGGKTRGDGSSPQRHGGHRAQRRGASRKGAKRQRPQRRTEGSVCGGGVCAVGERGGMIEFYGGFAEEIANASEEVAVGADAIGGLMGAHRAVGGGDQEEDAAIAGARGEQILEDVQGLLVNVFRVHVEAEGAGAGPADFGVQ